MRHVKLEMPSGLASKWKCQIGNGIFEPGAQARGQRYEMCYIHTQPEEMTFAKFGHDLSKQELVFVFCSFCLFVFWGLFLCSLQLNPIQSQASPHTGTRTCPVASLKTVTEWVVGIDGVSGSGLWGGGVVTLH